MDTPGDINIPFEWEKEIIKDYIKKAKEGVIDVPRIKLTAKRKKYEGEVLLLIGDADNQFSVEAAEVISKAYSKSKMILVHDTHVMQQNDKKYQNLRKIFFTKGLYSEEFKKISFW